MLATIKLNSSNNLVAVAKYLTGYSSRKSATNTFDSKFQDHIKQWQKKQGLKVDGIIGPTSWTKMRDNAPTCSTSKNKTSTATNALQILLGGLAADGIFGTKTKNAVVAYQKAQGLSADGICGPKTWVSLIVGDNSADSGEVTKTLNTCVKYLQWDSKWKNVKYSTHTSSQTIGNSGCGPTSMSMIMATWVDKNITPVEMCKLAVDNGYRTYSNGTSWSFFEFVFKKYKEFSKFITTTSVSTLKAALKEGALAVCSMNSNDNKFWTSAGRRQCLAC